MTERKKSYKQPILRSVQQNKVVLNKDLLNINRFK